MKASRLPLLLFLAVLGGAEVSAQSLRVVDLDNPEERRRVVEDLVGASRTRKEAAWGKARREGWKVRGEVAGGVYELMEMDELGRPAYDTTDNVNAAISTGANLIRNTAPYNLNGAGWVIGIWDGGGVRTTHQEFGSRATVLDGAPMLDHTTHVAGTIGAAGVDSGALGMAPGVGMRSYDWSSDAGEMTAEAATGPGQSSKIYISNHSYSTASGWDYSDYSGTMGWHWLGNYPEAREDYNFGRYAYRAPGWDALCYAAQYYLPFKSAGNDRNDAAPAAGTAFYYYEADLGTWVSESYNPATGPYDDFYDGGYDTIPSYGVAKNVMCVGAVDDAVTGGVRDVSKAAMSVFSGWGPADDGRIKPDIVANGIGLYSCLAGSDSDYGSYSGTSMSSPNAAGSAQLLVEYYDDLFPGQAMRASTLKALIIHTADDLGTVGPDYSYGWGLMNAKAAADHIKDHSDFPWALEMAEGVLNASEPSHMYSFDWDGSSPIRVTLCWTDPDHFGVYGLDNPQVVLINDLDLRVHGPGGLPIYFPYVLDPANPADPATTSDNTLDNVEQVFVAAPEEAGTYAVQVSHKGTLRDGEQWYSLIVSGQSTEAPAATSTPTIAPGATSTPTEAATNTPAPVLTETPTETPTDTATPTRTETPADTATGTPTEMPTAPPTDTATATVTDTPPETPTDTRIPTLTETPMNTATPTAAATSTETPTPSSTNTPACAGYEADVAPRPDGGNACPGITDWVQVGRFAAGVDTAVCPCEFQKADCAPRSSSGNGAISITDWVQAGRYAAAVDACVPAGGPACSGGGSALGAAAMPGDGGGPDRGKVAADRTVRVVGADIERRKTGAVKIGLDSEGDENALGFSLDFDASLLAYVSAAKGSGASAATLFVNSSEAGSGRLGLALALGVGESFAAGTHEIVVVTFEAAAGNDTALTGVVFGDVPIVPEASDALANPLMDVRYEDGEVTVAAPVSATPTWYSSTGVEPDGWRVYR